MLTTLRVWTDGEDWIIAHSAERAHELRAASYGERPEDMGDLADWEALPDDRVVRVLDELDDDAVSRTAAEWVAVEGEEGFLCSTEF